MPDAAGEMSLAEALRTRRSVGKVSEPGPDTAAITRLLEAAVLAPDHGTLRPWRFIVLRGQARECLGEAFAAALLARRADADEAALAADRSKPLRAPVLITVVSSPVPSPVVPEWEQLLSAAAATQNLLLAAHAEGFGAMWRTGWFTEAPAVREELAVRDSERIVGWVYLGTPAAEPLARPEVKLDDKVTWRDA